MFKTYLLHSFVSLEKGILWNFSLLNDLSKQFKSFPSNQYKNCGTISLLQVKKINIFFLFFLFYFYFYLTCRKSSRGANRVSST